MMDFARLGAALAVLGVALGAFGAHALREHLPPPMLHAWNTAVLYHLLHAIALFALGLRAQVAGAGARAHAGPWLLLAGLLLFSGSLYAMALTGVRSLGAITPVGGVLFILGWAWLAVKKP